MYETIFKVIQPEVDKEFYSKVLSFYVRASRDIEKYRLLQSYLNKDQRIAFIKTNKNWMNFYVEMLAEESQYQEILEVAKNHHSRADIWSSSEGNLNNIILPILNVYPAACFEILQSRVKEALRTGRGRGVYIGVTKWMQHLLKIKGYEAKGRQFIDELVVQFKNYRALKEEMRNGGII